MAYTTQTWVDSPSTTTPISAARLSHIETGIADAHTLAAASDKRTYRIVYSGAAYVEARPSSTVVAAGYVEYVGPTQPTDWLVGDTWIEKAA